jgi:hypothetical protein
MEAEKNLELPRDIKLNARCSTQSALCDALSDFACWQLVEEFRRPGEALDIDRLIAG